MNGEIRRNTKDFRRLLSQVIQERKFIVNSRHVGRNGTFQEKLNHMNILELEEYIEEVLEEDRYAISKDAFSLNVTFF
ncbi:MAG: hypothetical protein ACRCX8_20290 [Sarcina sp.]